LLAELVLLGRVEVFQGGLYVVRRDAPDDPLAHTTLAHLVAQRQHTDIRVWLAYLAESAVESVAQRLAVAGRVERVAQRRFGRSRVLYLPVDANDAAWPEVRLARQLTDAEPMPEPDVVLAALVAAAGLIEHVLYLPETRADALVHLRRVVSGLRPSLYQLVAHTESAVGDAVLAPR
jgi:hypothetical protein